MAKRIIISVTNDLVGDKRVYKVASSLVKNGFDVLVVGRIRKDSQAVFFDFPTRRFHLLFSKGLLFYAEYNFRLFLFLIFVRAEIFLSNDLDTLAANFLASKIRHKKLVYDSHELFTEVPELQERPRVQRIWKAIEKWILPKVKFSYTVCQSISDYYFKQYGIRMGIVRNIPEREPQNIVASNSKQQLPFEKKIILYQGALNVGRGIEYAVEAMNFVENAVLLIIGGGDIENLLKTLVQKQNLSQKVLFTGKLAFSELAYYTRKADLGLSLEENIGLNYYFALPNKLFDYIRAEIPVLVSRLPEMERVVNQYQIGDFIDNHTPKHIAEKMNFCLNNSEFRQKWKINLQKASKDLCWENEEKGFLPFFD